MSPDSVSADARQLVIWAGGNPPYGTPRKTWLANAARRLGITYRRARAAYYQEPVNWPAHIFIGMCQRFSDAIGEEIARQKAEHDALREMHARAAAVLAVRPPPVDFVVPVVGGNEARAGGAAAVSGAGGQGAEAAGRSLEEGR